MDREKVIREIEDALSDNLAKAGLVYGLSINGLKDKALADALAMLKEQNDCENCTIAIEDRQPVVRCKDCKYAHKTYDGDCKYCDMFTDDDGNPIERYRSGDWFCADGERREDE